MGSRSAGHNSKIVTAWRTFASTMSAPTIIKALSPAQRAVRAMRAMASQSARCPCHSNAGTCFIHSPKRSASAGRPTTDYAFEMGTSPRRRWYRTSI